MNKKISFTLQVAATYIGTVVGAGFATGQEIIQFFTVFQHWGVLGILISTWLFIWMGTKLMLLSKRINAYSYQELNLHLFGKGLGTAVNLFVFLILLGVTSVMVSGAGSIFKEQLGWPYQVGILFTLLLCYIVMLKGLEGIFIVNSLVVPMMICFSLIILVNAGQMQPGAPLSIFDLNSWLESWRGWQWIMSGIIYVAFNLAMAQAVLVPLGQEMDDVKVLRWGGILGGIGLGFMLLVSHVAFNRLMPDVLQMDVPMAAVIKGFGWLILALFLVVVYGEIFTTLIGNVFGLARQIEQHLHLPEQWIILLILITSFIISQVGFSALVAHLYPVFGYMGLLLLIRMIFVKTA